MSRLLLIFFVLQASSCIALVYARYNLDYHEQLYGVTKKTYLDSEGSGCECSAYTCGCCVYMDLPKIYLNDTGCMNISYLPKEYGIKISVTIDKWDLINMTISAKNPPPICFGEEFFQEHADLCLRFYDLNATYTSLHGCAQLIARLQKIVLAKYDLGCFDLGEGKMNFHLRDLLKYVKQNFLYIPHVFVNYLKSLETEKNNTKKQWRVKSLQLISP